MLDREIGGLFAAQDFSGVDARLVIEIDLVWPVARQAAIRGLASIKVSDDNQKLTPP